MKTFSILIFTIILSAFSLADSAGKHSKKLNTFELYNFCKIMASDKFEGRLSGSEGYRKSAEWVASNLKKWGLKPVSGLKGYMQTYRCPYTEIEKASMSIITDKANDSKEQIKELTIEKDFLPWLNSDSFKGTRELVFAGWGISAPELGYDDFAGMDVKDKFIICFRGSPDSKDKRFRKYASSEAKLRNALKKGVAGIIHIGNKPYASPGGKFIKGGVDITISRKVADTILKERGIDSVKLRKDLKTYKSPISFKLSAKIQLSVESRHYPNARASNVIGTIKGKSENSIVIGAHLDHCGSHAGLTFPGAHDNAAGCAVTMGVAKALADTKPEKTLIFVFFAGEEKGLVGAKHLTANLPTGMREIDYMVNFELCGIGTGIRCAGSSKHKLLRKSFIEASDKLKDIKVHFSEKPGGKSDYQAFAEKGIPYVCITGTGPHMNYHRSADTIFQVNPDLIRAISELTLRGVWKLAK